MESLAQVLISLLRRARLETLRRWGRRLGRLAFRLARDRRRVALANLDLAYGDSLTREEKVRIARASFENLVTTGLEFIYSPALGPDFSDYCGLQEIENFWSAYNPGKGTIAIIPHMGNWELIARFFAWAGVPAHAVSRRQRQAWVTRIVADIRRQNGIGEIDKREALRKVMTALRRGEVVCMLIDQHARREAIETRFFGHTAMTVASPALLALRTGCNVLVAAGVRGPEGGIAVHCSEVLETIRTGDPEADIQLNTQRYVDVIERFVRETPDCWMWMHRRWRAPSGSVAKEGSDEED
ncbi:MAG: lysophospholipid acyltransferase family protein [Candidatus Omnitrophica bacterium]|nr:Lipid A biosynthesis lauroyltransferase [bacterium]NUN97081.1 lysophospholipid acyltransferase family protein [Candidatus Omnitrophota bacterium]